MPYDKPRTLSAADINRRFLYPWMTPSTIRSYRKKLRPSIQHYFRGFLFEEAFGGFEILNPRHLRMRLLFLYWIYLHTGEIDYKLVDKMAKHHREFGDFNIDP